MSPADAASSAGNRQVRSPAVLERGATADSVAPTGRSQRDDATAQKAPPAFLVHSEEGAVVERSATTPSQTLIPHADAVLYDAALELVWFIENNQLLVLDLRARSAAGGCQWSGVVDGRGVADFIFPDQQG